MLLSFYNEMLDFVKSIFFFFLLLRSSHGELLHLVRLCYSFCMLVESICKKLSKIFFASSNMFAYWSFEFSCNAFFWFCY